MSVDETSEYFEGALQMEEHVRVPVLHETHRKRILYSPWVTRDIVVCVHTHMVIILYDVVF